MGGTDAGGYVNSPATFGKPVNLGRPVSAAPSVPVIDGADIVTSVATDPVFVIVALGLLEVDWLSLVVDGFDESVDVVAAG